MSGPAVVSADHRWSLELSCPRPRPRVPKQRQAWHLEPDRVRRTLATFFGGQADLELKPRTVVLHCSFTAGQLGRAPDEFQDRLGEVLDSLYFDVRRVSSYGPYQLPQPVRLVITGQGADPKQTSPIEGDQR